MPQRPLLFVGLDAADKDLILGWAAAGELPVLQDLLGRAGQVESENPPGLYIGAIWPSFMTGLSPSKHGSFGFQQMASGSYDYRVASAEVLNIRPFWVDLAAEGTRVAVIDVPKAPLLPQAPVLQVVDWYTHDGSYNGFVSYPKHVATALAARYGHDPVPYCNEFDRSREGYEDFIGKLEDRIRNKTAFARDLLNGDAYDAIFLGYGDSHCIGHQCWHLHDPAHDRHDQALHAALGDPLLRIYKALDRALGELFEAAGGRWDSIVLASHGMGPHYDGMHVIRRFLRPIDKLITGYHRPPAGEWPRRIIDRHRLRRWLPGLAAVAPPALPRDAYRGFFNVDNNEGYLGLRINLIGREPQGRIRPEHLDSVLTILADAFMTLRREPDGAPAFTEALRTRDLYSKIETEEALPDLLLRWDKAAPYEGLFSPRFGRFMAPYRGPRSGDHRPGGLALFDIQGMDPARYPKAMRVIDFAPTIAECLEVKLPRTDGRSIFSVGGADGGISHGAARGETASSDPLWP